MKFVTNPPIRIAFAVAFSAFVATLLKKPLSTGYSAGTSVRQHYWGGFWTGYDAVAKNPGSEWKKISSEMNGIVSKGEVKRSQFWPGTVYFRIIIHYRGSEDNDALEIRNVTLTKKTAGESIFLLKKATEKEMNVKVGIAETALEVPLFVELYGYGPFLGRRNRGTRDPLYCRAMSFSDGNRRNLIVITDGVVTDDKEARSLRMKITKEFKTEPAGIMFAATHTHSGPAMSFGIGWGKKTRNISGIGARP